VVMVSDETGRFGMEKKKKNMKKKKQKPFGVN